MKGQNLIASIQDSLARHGELKPWEKLGKRLGWLHVFQMAISTINLIMIAFLTGYIASHRLGFDGGLVAATILASIPLAIGLLAHWIGRHYQGYMRRRWVWLFLLFEITCGGCVIGAIAVLGSAGLPWNCFGLTGGDYSSFDEDRPPKDGFDTLGFGDGGSFRGELDKYCGLPKAYFWLAVFLILVFIYATSVAFRLIIALSRRAKNANPPPHRQPATHVAVKLEDVEATRAEELELQRVAVARPEPVVEREEDAESANAVVADGRRENPPPYEGVATPQRTFQK